MNRQKVAFTILHGTVVCCGALLFEACLCLIERLDQLLKEEIYSL